VLLCFYCQQFYYTGVVVVLIKILMKKALSKGHIMHIYLIIFAQKSHFLSRLGSQFLCLFTPTSFSGPYLLEGRREEGCYRREVQMVLD
jgi:hypothetical protein